MATHAVLIPESIRAMNIDSLNRSVIDYGASASSIDNGNVFLIDDKHTSGSLTEVFDIKQPTAGSPTHIWMAYSGDEVVLTDSKYKGLDPDPRNFYNPANYVFSAFKVEVGDIILRTADAFSNTFSSHTYAVPQADSFKLLWTNGEAGSGRCFKYHDTKYISLHTSSSTIDAQRVTAYELECIS
jgi:hypothetical protein